MGSLSALTSSALREKGEHVAPATQPAADQDYYKALNASVPVARRAAVNLAFANFADEGVMSDLLTDGLLVRARLVG